MALSRDRGTAKQWIDQGYGLVCDAQGHPIPDLIVADTNREHGIVADRNGGGMGAFQRLVAPAAQGDSRVSGLLPFFMASRCAVS